MKLYDAFLLPAASGLFFWRKFLIFLVRLISLFLPLLSLLSLPFSRSPTLCLSVFHFCIFFSILHIVRIDETFSIEC